MVRVDGLAVPCMGGCMGWCMGRCMGGGDVMMWGGGKKTETHSH